MICANRGHSLAEAGQKNDPKGHRMYGSLFRVTGKLIGRTSDCNRPYICEMLDL